MIRGRFLSYSFFVILLAFLFQPLFVYAGFGVTPPGVVADRLVPGAKITKTIYLVQGKPEEDLNINATIESRDIKDWISLENGNVFTIPKGVQQYPLKVTIAVPADAELGEYSGSIRIRTSPKPTEVKEEGGSGVTIALGGLITIDATVGDDVIVEFKITGLDILDITERETLKASVRIDNTGNAPASPDSASFELFDKFGNTRLAFATAKSDQFPRVPAFTEDAVVLEFPVDTVLAVGEYWGHVKIYDENGTVLRELRTIFNVNERTFLDIITSTGVLVGGVVFLALIIFLIVWRMRKRKSISSEEVPTDN